jgi:hypothetical protein
MVLHFDARLLRLHCALQESYEVFLYPLREFYNGLFWSSAVETVYVIDNEIHRETSIRLVNS